MGIVEALQPLASDGERARETSMTKPHVLQTAEDTCVLN